MMGVKDPVHVVARSSSDRAELARAAFALGHHAEIYTDYDELIRAKPERGIILAEDIEDDGGTAALIDHMAVRDFWCPLIATAPTVDVGRVVTAVRAGAVDYLAPEVTQGNLQDALHQAMAQSESTAAARREAGQARAKLALLTSREASVLDLLVKGANNKDIARELEISPRTVEIHRANMMSKLNARHLAEAIKWRLTARSLDGSFPSAAGK